MAPVTRDMPDELAAFLRQAAASRGIAEGAGAAEAKAPLAGNEPEMEQRIAGGRADVASGRTADHTEVIRWLRTWGTDAELPPARCD